MPSPPFEVDVRGLACSDAVVRVHRALVPLPEGSRVRVVTDDEALFFDLKRYAARSGHTVGATQALAEGAFEVEVRKGA